MKRIIFILLLIIPLYINAQFPDDDLAPNHYFCIPENVVNNDYVGTVETWYHLDFSDIVFSMYSNYNNAFSINSSTGLITIADYTNIDGQFAVTTEISIKLKVTNGSADDVITAYITVVEGDSCVFIDPDYGGTESGTRSQPYNDWDDVKPLDPGYGYFQKRGTVYNNDISTTVDGNASDWIYLGAYYSGEDPEIDNQEASRRGFYIGNSTNSADYYKIYNFFITNCGYEGIKVEKFSENLLFANISIDSTGFDLANGPNLYIRDGDSDQERFIIINNLKTRRAQEHGAKIEGAGVDVYNFWGYDNYSSGIQFSGDAKPVIQCYNSTLTGALLHNNTLVGLNIQGDTLKINYVVSHSNSRGIAFYDEPYEVELRNFISYGNSANGISFNNAGHNQSASNGKIYGNGEIGVRIYNSSYNQYLYSCAIYGNTGSGISLESTVDSIYINNCSLYDNANPDIVETTTGIIYLKNTIYKQLSGTFQVTTCYDYDDGDPWIDKSSYDFHIIPNHYCTEYGTNLGLNEDIENYSDFKKYPIGAYGYNENRYKMSIGKPRLNSSIIF